MTLLQTPCPYLTRDDTTHRYLADGLPVAISVTGVLAASDPPGKRERIMATVNEWAPRGNACHAALEHFIKSDRNWLPTPGCPTFSPYTRWILPLLTWPAWDHLTFTASELMLHCPTLDLSGQFDGAYRSPSGGHVLFDLKSRSQPHSGTYSTAAQLGGYITLAARWGLHFDSAATIWARPNRYPTVSVYSISDCQAAWQQAWDTYQATLPF
jgi:hypothetical protein